MNNRKVGIDDDPVIISIASTKEYFLFLVLNPSGYSTSMTMTVQYSSSVNDTRRNEIKYALVLESQYVEETQK